MVGTIRSTSPSAFKPSVDTVTNSDSAKCPISVDIVDVDGNAIVDADVKNLVIIDDDGYLAVN